MFVLESFRATITLKPANVDFDLKRFKPLGQYQTKMSVRVFYPTWFILEVQK